MAQAIADGIFFAEVTRSHSGDYSLGHFNHASYDMYLPNVFASAEEVQEDIDDDRADQDKWFDFNQDEYVEGNAPFVMMLRWDGGETINFCDENGLAIQSRHWLGACGLS